MPELPEVENLRRGLEKNIVGQKILRVKVHKPKLVSGKGAVRKISPKKVQEFEQGLKGERFSKIERRAKNLIFRFASGKAVLVHLKMSGQFVYKTTSHKLKAFVGGHPIEISEKQVPNKHTHVIFELERGTLYYNDTRMFGYLLYYESIEAFEKENHFALLGLEPFDKKFTAEYLQEALKSKKSRIKSILMDQKIVTGLGNIYADESLFESRIHPERSASLIKSAEISRLYQAIIRIMHRAIEVGGSSVATYRLLDESMGNYAREHKVYGKEGEKCPRCGKPLKKILIQSRTTIFCPRCQK
jgi:formamidopyrimidine-DNA glycosylase